MDSYPDDLLVGVFPLVFAVDAMVTNGAKDQQVDDVTQEENRRRGLFDRFLDAVAASLIDEDEIDENGGGFDPDRRRTVSLFRPDDEEESSDDEDLLFVEGGGGFNPSPGRKRGSGVISSGLGFGLRQMQPVRSSDPEGDNNGSGGGSKTTSYARALTDGQGFFQRARIVSVSSRYGFPPSKDPDGSKSLAYDLPAALRARSAEQLSHLFKRCPLDGILQAGWLDKHVHALPSVILVVSTLCSSEAEQEEQDSHLFETMEHLRYSLVPKRQCKIHVIGLMHDDITMDQGEEWSRSVGSRMSEDEEIQPAQSMSAPSNSSSIRVNLLRVSTDLQSSATDMPTSPALKKLHQTVRDASMTYYMGQARRVKQKLAAMNEETRRRAPPPQLLPLVIRYCFEIAIFYEFQLKHVSSLKFMSEAHRHVVTYYRYLLDHQQEGHRDQVASDTTDENATVGSNHPMSPPHTVAGAGLGGDGGVEVALKDRFTIERAARMIPAPPDDMLHQCRVVAEWCNLKLLSAALGSRTTDGLVAASHQWREHTRVFCSSISRRRRTVRKRIPGWDDWQYVARQRLVMSQLTERYPPTTHEGLGMGAGDVLQRCSPWRNYESAAEAILNLARELTKAKDGLVDEVDMVDDSEKDGKSRSRFVGGENDDGMTRRMAKECKINHREKALELTLRAISMFEQELQREKRGFYAEDEFSERTSSRTGARLYYLAGGILLGMERHRDSAGHLIKAAKLSVGWRELELSVRRMLIECYEKHIPSQTETTESSQTLASTILDSYFNAEMSSKDLRRALGHLAFMTGGESLKWYHSSVNEEDVRLPFSFAVSFPDKTHATAGDTVKASVLIKSNLDYAVHVNSAVLLSLAGQLDIPTNDLLRAANANEGSEGGIIIQAKTAIIISTNVDLPKDPSIIASDESGNGGEQQGVAGKGSFAKSARPRTSGITSAGGARLVSEDKLMPGNSKSQGWNLRYLGGKPLRCDGLRLVFYPVQAERASAEKVTLIEVTIEKQKPRTAANIKRTPFEEENYIASAWSRPLYLPLSRGPRSLRVLGFSPQMVISNLTEDVTNGKALEGTVNRILLSVRAGSEERCMNVRCEVSCFSVLVTPSGSTKRLVPKEATAETEDAFDMKDPRFRTPVLVKQRAAGRPSSSETTEYGFDLPSGWIVAGTGQGDAGPTIPSLRGGESTLIHLDFFRPAALMQKEIEFLDANIATDDLGDLSLCKTDIYVTISYRQERPLSQRPKRAKRLNRKLPVMASGPRDGSMGMEESSTAGDRVSARTKELSDEVSLEYSGSIVWAPPLSATFTPGVKSCPPSGSRHPSNAVEQPSRTGVEEEFALVDGESVTTKCSLQLESAMEGLKTDIVAVRFLDNADAESPVGLSLESGPQESKQRNILYQPDTSDPSRTLSPSSKVAVSYTVQANLKDDYKRGGVSATLGAIQVDWLPSMLRLPSEAERILQRGMPSGGGRFSGPMSAHGALVLSTPSAIRFKGPPCYIESAPFAAVFRSVIPEHPKVAESFEISYHIENKTSLHQVLQIKLSWPSTSVTPRRSGGNSHEQRGGHCLFSGLSHGELVLAPSEKKLLSYTVLATRPGNVQLPVLDVTSGRYRSRVVDSTSGPRGLFVFP